MCYDDALYKFTLCLLTYKLSSVADVGAAANTIVGACGRSRIFEWGEGGQVPKARGWV